ncbi:MULTISPECIES: hypothetical protein [unclassified Streptomyces]|uniref:hypothetical protein n=1 Tax=unclassified Streptomyces TaxID=2593676 RepID=UPI002E2E1DC7|nr:hypothetical protein [Streptomyces sp. NBC_01439]
MTIHYGYYAATDDAHAAEAVEHDTLEEMGSGYDQLVLTGIDPEVHMPALDTLISGRSVEAVEADPPYGRFINSSDDGGTVCHSFTEAFRDALAGLAPEKVRAVAADWAVSEVFRGRDTDADVLAQVLTELAGIARDAADRGDRLYYWIGT